jgi:hypothetical protein
VTWAVSTLWWHPTIAHARQWGPSQSAPCFCAGGLDEEHLQGCGAPFSRYGITLRGGHFVSGLHMASAPSTMACGLCNPSLRAMDTVIMILLKKIAI